MSKQGTKVANPWYLQVCSNFLGKEQFSSSMDSSINKLTSQIVSTPLPNVDGYAFVETRF